MIDFVEMFEAIDATTKTSVKVDAIHTYLNRARETDKVWAIAILMGNKPKRPVKTTDLRSWAADISGVPLWLLEESYYIVGDLAETLSLVIPTDQALSVSPDLSLSQVFADIHRMRVASPEEQRLLVSKYWEALTGTALFVFNKFLTGNFRIGVSRKLVVKAVAKYQELGEAVVEHRLMGKWDPSEESMHTLFSTTLGEERHFLPYPFYLAYALDDKVSDLGPLENWVIEPKLDGIRGQLILRRGELFVWSRGEDLMTDKFVEFQVLKELLPDGTVIDGEIIPWKDDAPLDFALMQTRISRKNVSKAALAAAPLVMVCYDLLEWKGEDIRHWPLAARRKELVRLWSNFAVSKVLKLSKELHFKTWGEADAYRIHARNYQSEGLMLKRRDSPYEVGRKRGNWWKWKTDPMTIDGVLIYAQSGHGRRANLFTDYTFAVWDQGELVPFAKAYSGLTDKELLKIDHWIKRNTIEKFGPVRSVKPVLVFELAFEGIQRSTRHKSGVALRFPRIVRWRQDKPASEANTKDDLEQFLQDRNT